MLFRIRKSLLASNGLLIMAVALPFIPYVESTFSNQPLEMVYIYGNTFEAQVNSLLDVAHLSGFELVSWTKLPYLSNSVFDSAYHVLFDALFVLKPMPGEVILDA